VCVFIFVIREKKKVNWGFDPLSAPPPNPLFSGAVATKQWDSSPGFIRLKWGYGKEFQEDMEKGGWESFKSGLQGIAQITGNARVRTNERTPRSTCPCSSFGAYHGWIFPWWRMKNRRPGYSYFLLTIFSALTQAGSEVSALLGRMPSAVGYQPTWLPEMGIMQERITSTKRGSITSVQAVYVPGWWPDRPGTGYNFCPPWCNHGAKP